MRQSLIPHPDEQAPAGLRIAVEAVRPRPSGLVLSFVLTGPIAAVRLPGPAVSARADELWRRTCFEAFLRGEEGEGYVELNFSPSTEWAAYRFSGYRIGMSGAAVRPPRVETRASAKRYQLEAAIELDDGLGLAGSATWRLGLSAVIEDKDGHVSHWALRHPPSGPDFHHAEGFAFELS
jgi:hypothetical protein